MDDFPFGKEYFGRLCQTVSSQVGGGARRDGRLEFRLFCLTIQPRTDLSDQEEGQPVHD